MFVQDTHHLSENYILEFFDPALVLVTLHRSAPGEMHGYVSNLERMLQHRLPAGTPYFLIFNPVNKRDDSLSPEDIALIGQKMTLLSQQYPCRMTGFIMNDGLSYHIHRAMAESFSHLGVFRATSLADAVRQIEAISGCEVVFDHLPVSCC